MSVVRPTGLTKDDGTFTLTTGDKSGARVGQYVVTIICTEVPADAKKNEKDRSTGGAESQDRLQGAYADSTKSTIKVEIKKGKNKLDPFRIEMRTAISV